MKVCFSYYTGGFPRERGCVCGLVGGGGGLSSRAFLWTDKLLVIYKEDRFISVVLLECKKKHFWEKVIYASSVTPVVNKLMFRGR